jgi:hypothetical protein
MADPTATQIHKLIRLGYAMPNGSYYIRAGSVGASDLENAIDAVGRASGQDGKSDEQERDAVRVHIMKRAKDLGLTSKIPDTWESDGTLKHVEEEPEEPEEYEEEEETLTHFEDDDLWNADGTLKRSDEEIIEEFLEHHGVKGMKWGVRKDQGHEGERAKTKAIEKADRKFEKKANTVSTFIDLHNRAAQLSNSRDVDRINNKPQYKDADFTEDSPLRRKYYKEHADSYLKNLNQAAREKGTNASGTRQYKINVNPDGTWHVTTASVEHAANTPDSFTVYPKYDAKGCIQKIHMSPDSVHHMDEDDDDEFLEHHGVKGMKWGSRKEYDDTLHPDYTRSQRIKDASLVGARGVKHVNRRMNAGQNHHDALTAEVKRAAVTTAAIAGALLVSHVLQNHGHEAAEYVSGRAETNRGQTSFSNKMGIENTRRTMTPKPKRGVHKITTA